jgi:phage tail sheath protein FI
VEAEVAVDAKTKDIVTAKKHLHQGLKAVSPTYGNIINEIRIKLNQLPPSGAMAGIYTSVDNSRGVWKAPANVSVNMVNAPAVNISSEGQQNLNVDVMAGKSINVIRSFPGIGSLVWGGRTLDGNSQDWRYINVRRTLIMIEQSIKLATRAYVFEANDANTWVTVKSMIENFLTNLWKQGALAGAGPEAAFDVQIGLGSTMTPTDILDGKMLITVKVALVRPAEFIVITFQQQQQTS